MISLILTVLNEGESIRPLLDSILAQTQPPDEIVIVDGGSRDHTVAVLREYADRLPLKLVVEPGANISQGRNRAIAEAAGDIIAVTDAGVVLHPDWLREITAPFQPHARTQPHLPAPDATELLPPPGEGQQHAAGDSLSRWGRVGEGDRPFPNSYNLSPNTASPPIPNPQPQIPDVVAGFFQADPHTSFEAALGATTLPLADEIDSAKFLPSSRSVAFRKSAWVQIGGYPEWLDYGEDLVFDLRLKQAGMHFAFAPNAQVYFRPRTSARAFFRQYYLYARGDGKADLWRKRHAIRYATYLLALPALFIMLTRPHTRAFGMLGLLAGAFVYLHRPYLRLPRVIREAERVKPDARGWLVMLAWIPALRALGDVAKMLGYPAGWIWRWRNRSRSHAPRWRK